MNDWKDLDIGDIPSDFFVNERYEIELYNSSQKERGWITIKEDHLSSYRIAILDDINTQPHLKYRYRLKPLEPQKITREVFEKEVENHSQYDSLTKTWYNRKVEIIEE